MVDIQIETEYLKNKDRAKKLHEKINKGYFHRSIHAKIIHPIEEFYDIYSEDLLNTKVDEEACRILGMKTKKLSEKNSRPKKLKFKK